MKKIIFFICFLFLTSCGIVRVHKMDIEQGNVMTPAMMSQIHTGMSEEKVEDILGPPMLINTFDDNHVNYVYTYKPAYGPMTERRATLTFQNGVLANISNVK